MRRIAVIVGSDSDLSQCKGGLAALALAKDSGTVTVTGVYTMSVHRNMIKLFWFLLMRHLLRDVDVLIIGAGWANHLTGMCDAFLRYVLKNTRIAVVGIGFEDPKSERHTRAAELSVTEVPATQVVYGSDRGNFFGDGAFLRAVQFAVEGDLPKMVASKLRPSKERSLEEARTEAIRLGRSIA